MAMKSEVKYFIGVVVVIFLVAGIAPSAISSFYNTSAYCAGANCTANPTNVPAWVPTILGLLGIVGFIYVMLRE